MKRLILAVAAVALGLSVWTHWPREDFRALAEVRDLHALDTEADIVVAAVEDPQRSDYVKGIELAVAQINARPGKLLGRTVRLRIEQGSTDPAEENALVQSLASDEQVVAVLGHRSSSVALPASLVYEAARVVFIPPFATKKSLTGHSFQYVFRLAPSSPVMAEQIASLTALLGYGRVAVLHARDDYSRELAFLFEDSAVTQGVRIAHRSSFDAADEDYRGLLALLRSKTFDAVFLSAAGEPGARMARQLRELGVHTPILGSDTLNSRAYRDAAGEAGINTITPVLYRSKQTGWRNAAFAEQFQAAHHREPDHNAAQGYDSMQLLARAIESARTTRTSAVQSALRYMPYWVGVTGLHAFDAHGELMGKRYAFQQLLKDGWQALPGLHLRYNLERTEREARLGPTPLPAGFSQAFRGTASLDETATLQFEIARRILPVQRLGVLIAGRTPDAIVSLTERVQRLGDTTGVAMQTCAVREEAQEDDLVQCLATLSAPSPSQPQALMLVRFDDLSFADNKFVGDRLRALKVPAFALSAAGNRVMAPGLAVFVDEVGRQDYFSPAVQNLERMVPSQEVDRVVNALVNLPAVKVDLERLLALGHQSNPALLNLFADEMPPAAPVVARPRPAPETLPSPDADAASGSDSASGVPLTAGSAPTAASAPPSIPEPASAASRP